MAIKVRKRNERGDQSPDEDEDAPESAQIQADQDAFLRGSMQTISWFSENQNLVLVGFVVLVIGGIGTYVGINYMHQQEVAASAGVSSALEAFERPIEGSPRLEAMAAPEGVEKPAKTFETEKERWTAVYEKAGKTLKKHQGTAAAQSARLARAAAALRLGKYDDAIKLYTAYLDSDHPKHNLPIVHFGLAVAQSSKGKYDAAVTSLDEMVEADDSYEAFALYHKGLFMEAAGKTEKAKDFYNKVLETDPKSPYKSDIERRLALM